MTFFGSIDCSRGKTYKLSMIYALPRIRVAGIEIMQTNGEAEELNSVIRKSSRVVYDLLSKKGRQIYFPKKGILSQSAQANGKKINATIGIALEDDGSVMALTASKESIRLSPELCFPYAPSGGRVDLREKWKRFLVEKNPTLKSKEISLPVVVNGLTHGLSTAAYLFVDPEDTIILPNLFWENCDLVFTNNYDAQLMPCELFTQKGFQAEVLKDALNEGGVGKKIIYLNFPNNPLGYTPTFSEMDALVSVIEESADQGNQIVILLDDAYFGLVYEDGVERESAFARLCNLHEQVLVVKIDGATKEEFAWGLRVGFLTFGIKGAKKELYCALESKTAGAIRSTISNVSNLSQSVVANACNDPEHDNEKLQKFQILRERFLEVKHVLHDKKYAGFFKAWPFNSGYFMCIELHEEFDAEQVRLRLLDHYDTGVLCFGRLLRIAFSAVPKQNIRELFDNIYHACHDIAAKQAAQFDLGRAPKGFMELIDAASLKKLHAVANPFIEEIIDKYAKLCKPRKVIVLDDSDEDMEFIRQLALENGEEKRLKTEGHSIHFDGINDQGRDLVNTRVLLPKGKSLSKQIEVKDRDEGLDEIFVLMDGIMQGKDMLVKFYCLGPNNSKFSIPALQITDSAYVVHSENILYRQGYKDFMRLKGSHKFFHFIHSAGRLEHNVCKDIQNRRIYMDLEEERVFTVNNQYAGNSVGLKKLALRLAISKANREDWLCEHMFIMGAHPPGKDRITYFTGAFPSACGKTSTAMIPGQSIVGDDIAYIRPDEEGYAKAVNVEQGIFGIIEDVNPVDDALIHRALTTPRELIFSNVLIKDDMPYWLGMGKPLPELGINFSGEWIKGKTDAQGKEILAAHKNARYTIRISELENADKHFNSPDGVKVNGFIYGGRDSDTSVPVLQSLSWAHGVYMGAILESETTAAAIGKVGVRKHNPMSNIEFLTVPLGVYIKNHLKFGDDLTEPPLVFTTNYFLKDQHGKYLNQKVDKKVWLIWMEGRVHDEYNAIETPVGYVPRFEDLKQLFKDIFQREYTTDDYLQQFSIRARKTIDKLEKIEQVFRAEAGIPETFYLHLQQERERLLDAVGKFGKDVISPFEFE
jgi:phosphoenolpyruvate carboxykinase (GTP)